MTATLSPDLRHDALVQRLAALRTDRERTLAEITPEGSGDVADRATNVDGHVRLAMLDDRIAMVEDELANAGRRDARIVSNTVAVGDVVALDLGDGPETFLLGSLEQAAGPFDVITPGSPLGRAVLGASVGATVSYAAGKRNLSARIVSVG